MYVCSTVEADTTSALWFLAYVAGAGFRLLLASGHCRAGSGVGYYHHCFETFSGSGQPKTGPGSPTQLKTGSETRRRNAQTGQTSRDQARLR